MTTSYYILPLDTKNILSNLSLSKADINNSIKNFIHLIATTHFGECAFDETFGSEIWNIDFDNLTENNKLRYIIEDSLKDSIRLKETRLSNLEVDVLIKQEEYKSNIANRVKKRVEIKIEGIISKNNEEFSMVEKFYIAPLSY